jgi:hypothetical protein
MAKKMGAATGEIRISNELLVTFAVDAKYAPPPPSSSVEAARRYSLRPCPTLLRWHEAARRWR